MHLEAADQQTYNRLKTLFFDEYVEGASKEGLTFVQKCLRAHRKSFALQAATVIAVLTILPPLAPMMGVGAGLGTAILAGIVSRKWYLDPMRERAQKSFDRDIASGALTDRYEKELENLDDFETKMMRAGFDPIHSVGHETLRADALKETFMKQAMRAAAAVDKAPAQGKAPAPDAPAV